MHVLELTNFKLAHLTQWFPNFFVATHSRRIFNLATHWCKCKIFLKQNIVFEIRRFVPARCFVTSTTPLLFLDFMDFTGYHTTMFYFTVVAGDSNRHLSF